MEDIGDNSDMEDEAMRPCRQENLDIEARHWRQDI